MTDRGSSDVRETLAAPEPALSTIRRGLALVPVLRNGLLVTFVLASIGASARVVVPVLIQQAIDRGIVGRDEVDLELVTQMALVGAVVVVVATLSFRLASIRLGDRSERALHDLRVRLIDHIHQLSLADHNEERRGGLVARVTSDIETLAQFFQWGGMAWMRNTVLMVIVAIVMVAYDWELSLVAFVVAFPLVFVLRWVQRRLVRAYDRAREANGEMLGSIAEVVSGSASIRAYAAGESIRRQVEDKVETKARRQIRATLYGAFLFPSGELFSVFTVSAVIGVGVWRGATDGLTAGALVGFIFLTYRFLEPIAEFTEVLDQTQTAVAGLRRVLGVLDLPVGPPPTTSPIPIPAGDLGIEVDGVSFRYPTRANGTSRVDGPLAARASTDPPVLDGLDITISPGQQVALIGATGSGKTTLARLIARFADPSTGAVRLGGVDLRDISDDDLRSRVTVVSQEPFLFDDTVRVNVGFGRPDASLHEVEAIVSDLGLADWVAGLGEGLDTRVGQRGEQLSAGERQLVALIRAGLSDPDVLILDEATSSVDALTEVRIARALEQLASTRTTIAIAHRLSTAARADRVLVLESGRLVQDGHHDDLVQVPGVYRDLYDAWIASTTVDGSTLDGTTLDEALAARNAQMPGSMP